tara:strand:+ start:166 stop:1815 length:1650 start_codon:yes stop_codon:yes gene_type:complete
MQPSKKAYLYSRVSKTSQAVDGHGIERQVKAAKKFLENYPEYEVEEDTVISDLGVSAFSGANIQDAAGLGGFLKAVRDGTIPRGSLLVIEAPDRLTRLGIRKGQRLFDELAEHGIDVGLVRFGVIIKHDIDNDFTSSLIVSIGLYLGHLESQQKSERISATMAKRRLRMRQKELLSTPHCPTWLRPTADGEGFEFTEFAEVVRLMFKYRLEGLGGNRIAARLNEEGYRDTKGEVIRFQRVGHYLRSKAVTGFYQPHIVTKVNGKRVNEPVGEPITDFYPRLISDDDFYEVQRQMDTSHGGRRDKFNNYLRDLVKCPVESCGCNFTISVVMGRKEGVKYTYHKCIAKTSHGKPDLPKGCSSKAVSSLTVDNYVLPVLQRLNYVSLVSEVAVDEAAMKRIKDQIETVKETIAENRQVLSVLKGGARTAVEAFITEEEGRLQELRKMLSGKRVSDPTGTIAQYQDNIRNNTLETPQDRLEFNANLKQVIEQIVLLPDSWQIRFKGSDINVDLDYKFEGAVEAIEKFYVNRFKLESRDLSREEIADLTGLEVA